MSAQRFVVIMGSGETAPTMVKVHRFVLDRVGRTPNGSVMLDTPFGFQENADELCQKTIEHFDVSMQCALTVAGLRYADTNALSLEQALARVRSASYVFAGPGSPSFALRQWRAVPSLRDLLIEKISPARNSPGALVFSSAAALTVGTRTIPVYEIYKAGIEPHWLEGLNLLENVLPGAVIIPHFDNAEGGRHDTRFCYLGERRLRFLETEFSEEEYVFGVDEHTAAVLDLSSGLMTVMGKGVVTLRKQGATRLFGSGEEVSIDEIKRLGRSLSTKADSSDAVTVPLSSVSESGDEEPSAPSDAHTLATETSEWLDKFESAVTGHDSNGATQAALGLDDSIHAWAADPGHNDHPEKARAALRSMITRIGSAAASGLDPDEAIRPLMDVVLALRQQVRQEKRFDLSDLLRDQLIGIGIEVRDTAAGPVWVRS